MYTVLIVIHAMVTVALIGIILIQRNSSDMGLSASSSTSFLSGRSAATFITRATAVLATTFILLSLGIGILTARTHSTDGSLMDKITATPAAEKIATPASTPAAKPAEPAKPSPSSVPHPE